MNFPRKLNVPILIALATLLTACVSHLPKYPSGTLVTHSASGLEGQVIEWWCRGSGPCQYNVRFALRSAGVRGDSKSAFGAGDSGAFGLGSSHFEPTHFSDQLMMEYEIEATDKKQWRRLLEQQKAQHPNEKQPQLDPQELQVSTDADAQEPRISP